MQENKSLHLRFIREPPRLFQKPCAETGDAERFHAESPDFRVSYVLSLLPRHGVISDKERIWW